MDFLRIALFAVFLVAVVAWRNWMPATIGTNVDAQPDAQIDGQADVVAVEPVNGAKEGTNDLRIDGHPIMSVISIRNPQIIDGDSIRASSFTGPVEFRLASIDAPELSQPFGQRSKKYLQSITAGKELTAYQTDTDQYGRRVVFVFASLPDRANETIEVNAQMVADGYAWHAIRHSSNSKLTSLEANARAARLGLWEQSGPIAPWEFRDTGKRQRLSTAKSSP